MVERSEGGEGGGGEDDEVGKCDGSVCVLATEKELSLLAEVFCICLAELYSPSQSDYCYSIAGSCILICGLVLFPGADRLLLDRLLQLLLLQLLELLLLLLLGGWGRGGWSWA